MSLEIASDPTFETLLQAHVAALTGSLLDGAARGPDGAGFIWSRAIPDPTLNFAYGIRTPAQFSWAGAASLGRGRSPAFLARDEAEHDRLRAMFTPAATFPASWMVARPPPVPTRAGDPAALTLSPRVDAAFEEVFAQSFDDEAVRKHLRRTYLPALRRAKPSPGLALWHMILRDAAGPAACATLALRDGAAGLYNVSTRIDRQNRGLGAALVHASLREARARGAAFVFLQCPAGGPVEALYARAGFRTLYRPSLLCTSLTE